MPHSASLSASMPTPPHALLWLSPGFDPAVFSVSKFGRKIAVVHEEELADADVVRQLWTMADCLVTRRADRLIGLNWERRSP